MSTLCMSQCDPPLKNPGYAHARLYSQGQGGFFNILFPFIMLIANEPAERRREAGEAAAL